MSDKTYRIYNNSGLDKFVKPIGEISIKGQKAEDEYYYEKSISSFKLVKEDYDSLIQYKNSYEDFFIDIKCSNNILFKGIFSMQTAKICKDNCTIELSIDEDSIYNCLRDNDAEVNILNAPLQVYQSKLTTDIIDLEFWYTSSMSCNSIALAPPSGPCEQWSPFHQKFIFSVPSPGSPPQQSDCKRIYARQKATTLCLAGTPNPPTGTGWVNTSNGCTGGCEYNGSYYFSTWVRPYSGSQVTTNSTDLILNCSSQTGHTSLRTLNGTRFCLIDTFFGGNTINRSRLLKDVFEYLLQQTNCNVNCLDSELFEDSTNYVTTQSPNPLNYLMITEMSDVVRALATNPATILNLSLFGLYKQLKEVFQLIMKVDNNCLKIEHISKAIDNVINLEDIGKKVVSIPCCYSVNREEIPITEKWTFNVEKGIDFVGSVIKYEDATGKVYKIAKKDIEEHDVSEITTDVNGVFNAFNNTIDPVTNLDGYVLTVNDLSSSGFTVNTENGAITGQLLNNGHLSKANLHNAYWKGNRYLLNGKMNNIFTTFNSVKPYKKNEPNKIIYCCGLNSNKELNFDFTSINTKCGTGIIETYNLDLKTNLLKLNISLF